MNEFETRELYEQIITDKIERGLVPIPSITVFQCEGAGIALIQIHKKTFYSLSWLDIDTNIINENELAEWLETGEP